MSLKAPPPLLVCSPLAPPTGGVGLATSTNMLGSDQIVRRHDTSLSDRFIFDFR